MDGMLMIVILDVEDRVGFMDDHICWQQSYVDDDNDKDDDDNEDDGDDDDSACDGGCCDKGRGVSIFMIGLWSMAVLIVTVEVVTAGLRRLLFKMSSTCRSARNVTNCLYRSYIDEWMDR